MRLAVPAVSAPVTSAPAARTPAATAPGTGTVRRAMPPPVRSTRGRLRIVEGGADARSPPRAEAARRRPAVGCARAERTDGLVGAVRAGAGVDRGRPDPPGPDRDGDPLA